MTSPDITTPDKSRGERTTAAVELVAVALIVAGVAMWSAPVAFIVAGVLVWTIAHPIPRVWIR
ncbi:tetrahydromethanopterin S-methyltransferase subunit C [Microbacterium marinum]|uniref:Tetrahydromethanopterin S-methyltransferase subunit C n=1 Tax=Microbacterium marinum TaxID=421115 RepID=A0A7W7BQI7_9MICO|nr:hypothetical protein [Microbacterium marinum]MBB4666973.1 tetrahydromethanopterin S-methyltransferase subunit C [Microbacterium marinum]